MEASAYLTFSSVVEDCGRLDSSGPRAAGVAAKEAGEVDGKVDRVGLALEGGETTVLACSGLGAGLSSDLGRYPGQHVVGTTD